MKAPHLLRVEEGPERFAALFAAMGAAGLRAGWLELRQPEPPAPSLEAAAALGARRAVAAGGGRSVAWKPLRGEPVLSDLLREHFLGCALVLVRGTGAAAVPLAAVPALSPAGDGWRLARPGDAALQHYETSDLVAALRRPRPWASRGGTP
ncbi:MAG: hypothetical protein JOZ15_05415 [Acidobacteria bacterium]|nr:hypothetical protein [Acidobacteriota bacterium]